MPPDTAAAPKIFIKLKRMLAGCTHFRLHHLETQFVAGSVEWDLGVFYDFEVERIRAACAAAGMVRDVKEFID